MTVSYHRNPDTGKVHAVLREPQALAEFRLEAQGWVYLPGLPVSGGGLTGNYYEDLPGVPPEVTREPTLADIPAASLA